MRRPAMLGLAAVVTLLAALAAACTAGPSRPGSPDAAAPAACPQPTGMAQVAPVHLVADLEQVPVRDTVWRRSAVAAAEAVLAGRIPAVRPPAAGSSGDPVRYLFNEGVALRRLAGTLGLAYASSHDPRYLDALAAQTVGAVRWPDWNPGHPLDTAQVGTAVALGYAWSRDRMSAGERQEVTGALVDRLLDPYLCRSGSGLAARRTAIGNQATVVGTAAVLAGLAVRADQPAWSAAAVEAGAASIRRTTAPTGSGRSLAEGPTVEGLMYTTYEAANLALLQATVAANPDDQGVTTVQPALPAMDGLADWNERCGRVADPAVQDAWDLYPWVDRTTALAAMAGSARSGPHLLALIDGLQARNRLTLPAAGVWDVPDGIAELVLTQLTPGSAAPPPVQALVSGGAPDGRRYGCATHEDTFALLTGVPNDAPHAHADVGNVVVKQGEQTVLADLGQRTYGFRGGPVWRSGTKAHTTVGVLQDDGSVRQARHGAGVVSVDGDDLLMSSGTALPGVSGWARRVAVGDGTVQVRDTLTTSKDGAVPLSTSFLLEATPSAVTQQPDGSLRFTVADGGVWDLVPPAGAAVTFSDAAPTPPYVDAPDVAGPAAAHTLVVLRTDLVGTLDLTTELRRVG